MLCINQDVYSLNFQTDQDSQMFQISDFVARKGILCRKLEVCLPLACPITIYKHFSSLKPLRYVDLRNLTAEMKAQMDRD